MSNFIILKKYTVEFDILETSESSAFRLVTGGVAIQFTVTVLTSHIFNLNIKICR